MSNTEPTLTRTLPPQGVRVGSQPDCDIVLADSSVEPLHAEIQAEGSTLTVINKTDARGVALVRGGRSTALFHEPIHAGDRVRFGTVEMSFEEILEAIRFRYPNFTYTERPHQRRLRTAFGDPDRRRIWLFVPLLLLVAGIVTFL